MIRELDINDIITINELIKEFNNIEINLNSDPFTKYYVYDEGNTIKGFISYAIIYDRCELNYIFVKKKYRHQGIASKLMDYMIDNCNRSKCDNITLEVNENNVWAITLYHKYGFKEIAHRKNYYGKEHGILMERVLKK